MQFHGAFADKKTAKKKEKEVHGFIQPRNIKGQRRFVVMSERKNPIRRSKRKEMRKATREQERALAKAVAASGMTWEQYQRVRRAEKKNPMDLVVMGANPGEKEIVVQPGQTITFKFNPDLHNLHSDVVRRARNLYVPGSNPSAEVIREGFVGKPVDKITIYNEPHMVDGEYAKLGTLVGIDYKPVHGGQVQAIGFYRGAEKISLLEAAKKLHPLTQAPVVVSDQTRKQIYFVGGIQDISPTLDEVNLHRHRDDVWELGKARHIVYREQKRPDKFELINYVHDFREHLNMFGVRSELVPPTLLYDAKAKRLLLEGGEYTVEPEGIN